MLCDCQETAFIITKYVQEDDKLVVYRTYTCGRTLMEETKKKLKCKFNKVEKIRESFIQPAIIKNTSGNQKPQETCVDSLERTIGLIKINQMNNIPFDHFVYKIMFLSKQLNIPKYTPSKHTIEEYCNIANYYIRNPIKCKTLNNNRSLKIITGIDDLLKPKIIPKQTSPTKSKLVPKKYIINKTLSTKFITGGQDADYSQNDEEENLFDVEEFDSEIEDNVEEDECLSD